MPYERVGVLVDELLALPAQEVARRQAALARARPLLAFDAAGGRDRDAFSVLLSELRAREWKGALDCGVPPVCSHRLCTSTHVYGYLACCQAEPSSASAAVMRSLL